MIKPQVLSLINRNCFLSKQQRAKEIVRDKKLPMHRQEMLKFTGHEEYLFHY